MNARSLISIIVVVMFCATIFSPAATETSSAEDTETTYFLLDKGNGDTEWMEQLNGNTVQAVIEATLVANGHDISFSSGTIVIDGKGPVTIGTGSGTGSLTVPGTTDATPVTSEWKTYSWDGTSWNVLDNLSGSCAGPIAVGFYPSGVIPVETPDCMSSWTCLTGDSTLSYNQQATLTEEGGETVWAHEDADEAECSGVYGSVLYAHSLSFVKYGNRNVAKPYDLVVCYDEAGDKVWSFKYDSTMYDTSTMAIYGSNIYIQSTNGYMFTFDFTAGPGDDNYNVKTYNGKSMSDSSVEPAPTEISTLKGSPYGDGFGSITFDSGCIFVKHRNGMTYCFDKDLNLIWSYLSGGYNYFLPPTVADGYVIFGSYDGCLYVLDEKDGSLVASKAIYQEDTQYVGCVCGVTTVSSDDGSLTLFLTYNDGKGMNSKVSGLFVLSLKDGLLSVIKNVTDEVGSAGNFVTAVVTDSFTGIYLDCGKGLCSVDTDGNVKVLNSDMVSAKTTHAAAILVNEKYLYYTTYSALTHKIYVLNLDGEILKEVDAAVEDYCMAPATVVDGFVFCGNDGGSYCLTGIINDYHPPVPKSSTDNALKVAMYAAIAVAILAALYAFMKFGLKWEHPLQHIRSSFYRFLYGEEYAHYTRKKHRLWLILLAGFLLTFAVGLLSLCIGPETMFDVPTAFKTAWSAISKGGKGLTYEEMLIYNSRLPRTLAAFAVGIGLSVAGAIYQAIIKNPLVEPYIMGVSSGAGTMAVAVLVCDFTFFGLFPLNSPGLTIIAAMFGGLLAFGCTMLLSEKTGGKPINYVLSGIVIGLVFSAVQSIMMVSAGNNVGSALSWLYGSFSSMDWDKLWLVLIPVTTLSLAPMVWAKEYNLVLLGEDQAKQMGLDAHKFDMIMLILASVLTAFCVAFCGIIGFVGLVVPHLCRMIVGGDHRLVFPSTVAFGGAILILADLIARSLITGYELPVGAITTVIGVPVFAYLLVKRGKNYD